MKKKLSLLISLIIILTIITGCSGRGNLKVIVHDQQQNPINDVYVGLYKSDFDQRIRFAYTHHGEIEFAGLESGVYWIRIISPGQQREMKVKIDSQKNKYIKVNLGTNGGGV
ncbi:hypothetical protein [Sporohalobacter salinus]|uniref:hypothetical protein n=1 Tax=Sporohalobacter salinus TaxID=1494606 RepID=UPI001961C115|nr:hypothetical protein [Sporohalobacter salinus]MBM7624611.1 PBP1b-binding outer membrane lipoprotein LpoB [Sporohalobacter salinus]